MEEAADLLKLQSLLAFPSTIPGAMADEPDLKEINSLIIGTSSSKEKEGRGRGREGKRGLGKRK